MNKFGLKITSKANQKVVEFLDVILDLENEGVTIGTQVGQFAMGYVKTQIERQKTAEKAELLSVVIEQAIDETQSLNAIMESIV